MDAPSVNDHTIRPKLNGLNQLRTHQDKSLVYNINGLLWFAYNVVFRLDPFMLVLLQASRYQSIRCYGAFV